MATKRKYPFGYAMQLGKISINEQEAKLVTEIFTAYANGISYRQLTDRLNAQTIPYNEPENPWNKNMIARVLCCETYMGNDIYPAIVSTEQWNAANAAKPNTGKALDENSDVKAIRQLALCARCGNRLKIWSSSRSKDRWMCTECGTLTAKAVTTHIRENLCGLITQLINDPRLVSEPDNKKEPDIAEVQEESMAEALNRPVFDELYACQMAFALASARFDSIGSEVYETQRIREAISNARKQDSLDTMLLKEIATAVLIHPDGAVSLRLKNSQIVERKVCHGRNSPKINRNTC